MASTLTDAVHLGHRLIPKKADRMAKSDLRKAMSEDAMREIGECLDAARCELRWTIDELAGKLPPPPGAEVRSEKQVRAWLKGDERVQMEVVFAVRALRAPFVEALARLSGEFEEHREFKRKMPRSA